MGRMRGTVPAVLAQMHSTVTTTTASRVLMCKIYHRFNFLSETIAMTTVETDPMKLQILTASLVTIKRASKGQTGKQYAQIIHQHTA